MALVDEIVDTPARIAVYDDLLSSPRIIDISPAAIPDFIEQIAATTYENARALGGKLPYTVIREITENFIHAHFKECIVSVFNEGNTVRFSDQGPGIDKKEWVLHPGVSSATSSMKQYIRGVGSGFPIVHEYLERVNGYLFVDDNAIEGTVITMTLLSPSDRVEARSSVSLQNTAIDTRREPSVDSKATASGVVASTFVPSYTDVSTHAPTPAYESTLKAASEGERVSLPKRTFGLSEREEKTLMLLYSEGLLGSGDLTGPLGVSAPTATRLLQRLEQLGFVEVSTNKKRILSNKGLAHIQAQGQKG